jgi:hypothetical protein
MSGDSRPRRTRFDLKDESGQVLLFVVGALMTLLVVSAFVIDVGHVFWVKRKLQSSADSAALAGAFDLPNEPAARAAALQYSGTVGRRNHEIPGTQTSICLPSDAPTAACQPQANKIIVEERATVDTFFGGLVGVGSYSIKARAVASRGSTTTGTPLAVYVHELCGASTGNKGLIAAGKNMRIEGGIHINGHLEVGDSGFNSVGRATVYRPPPQGSSPAGPTQGSGCKTTDQPDSMYCTGCPTGPVTAPAHGAYRDWATPYHTQAILKAKVPCTFSFTNDTKFENTTIPDGVYCLPADKKFTIAGNVNGRITVIAGFVEIGGTGTLEPYSTVDPVLFYSTNTAGTSIKLNPSGAYDWTGYIINRQGGIELNAASVTSPYNGLLESEWIQINGENFRMLGTFPDSSSGGMSGALQLDE